MLRLHLSIALALCSCATLVQSEVDQSPENIELRQLVTGLHTLVTPPPRTPRSEIERLFGSPITVSTGSISYKVDSSTVNRTVDIVTYKIGNHGIVLSLKYISNHVFGYGEITYRQPSATFLNISDVYQATIDEIKQMHGDVLWMKKVNKNAEPAPPAGRGEAPRP